MSAVKFSVVIPTRGGTKTLHHTLRTCVDQNFEDYEVIVSDNDGPSSINETVQSIDSPRVRYVRSPKLLSMASSWDFALTHTRGSYVILLGDDDALLPHALHELDGLTSQAEVEAVRWEPAFYTWPDFPVSGQDGYLRVPIHRGVHQRDGMDVIRQVIEFRESPSALPSFYHGAIHRDVMKQLREKGQGRLFPNGYPAIYAGFAVAATVGKFVTVDAPMSINAQSARSISAPRRFSRNLWSAGAEFRTLNEREGLKADPRVPDLPIFPHAPVADAFYAASKVYFPENSLQMNRRQMVAGCVSNLRPETAEDWRAGLAAVRESLIDEPELLSWFENGLGRSPFRSAPPRVRSARLGFDDTFLHLDAKQFGVTDVTGAVGLCERILNYRRDGARLDVRGGIAAEAVELRQTVVRQSEEIESLRKGCEDRARVIARLKRQRSPIFWVAGWAKQLLSKSSNRNT